MNWAQQLGAVAPAWQGIAANDDIVKSQLGPNLPVTL